MGCGASSSKKKYEDDASKPDAKPTADPTPAVMNVGDTAVVSAQDPFTAAIKTWKCEYLTGQPPVVKEVKDEGAIVVGFEECYQVYFHKYSVTIKSEGQWEVKMVEKGDASPDKSGFPPLDQGYFHYGGEGEPLKPLLPFGGPLAAAPQFAKTVGDVVVIRAEDPVTAAVKSWPTDNQTGTIMVKSAPPPSDLVEVGFQECYCCYFNKYRVYLKSVGLWDVKLVEKGMENPDMSKFTQTEGFIEYLWDKVSIRPANSEALPTEGDDPGPSTAVMNVGDTAVMSAPNPFTAAIKSFKCPYLTGRYVLKEVADEGAIVVGFEECYQVYFHKYSVTMVSEGQWEVKMVEKGEASPDKSGFPPLDQGYFDYGGEEEPLKPLLQLTT